MTPTPARTFKFRKLPAVFHAVVLPFFLSLFMTCIVSGISTWHTLGFAADFPAQWMGAWGISWIIGFPTLLFVLPLARKVVAVIVEPARAG